MTESPQSSPVKTLQDSQAEADKTVPASFVVPNIPSKFQPAFSTLQVIISLSLYYGSNCINIWNDVSQITISYH